MSECYQDGCGYHIEVEIKVVGPGGEKSAYANFSSDEMSRCGANAALQADVAVLSERWGTALVGACGDDAGSAAAQVVAP